MVELLRLNEGNDVVLLVAGTEKYRILNDGRFKTSETSYVQFTGAIHSSETRYYKLIVTLVAICLMVCVIQANRNGGFNQSAGFRNYNCAVGGYSNALYGPMLLLVIAVKVVRRYTLEVMKLSPKLTPNTYGEPTVS